MLLQLVWIQSLHTVHHVYRIPVSMGPVSPAWVSLCSLWCWDVIDLDCSLCLSQNHSFESSHVLAALSAWSSPLHRTQNSFTIPLCCTFVPWLLIFAAVFYLILHFFQLLYITALSLSPSLFPSLSHSLPFPIMNGHPFIWVSAGSPDEVCVSLINILFG